MKKTPFWENTFGTFGSLFPGILQANPRKPTPRQASFCYYVHHFVMIWDDFLSEILAWDETPKFHETLHEIVIHETPKFNWVFPRIEVPQNGWFIMFQPY